MKVERGLGALSLGAIVLALLPAAAAAETFTAACTATTGSPASLVAAIDAANANGGGADLVTLGPGCVYTLTSVNNNWYGPNGLPAIASDITIQGNGATIARLDGAPNFRFFFVGADPAASGYVSPGAGKLTLRELTLTGGLAKGGDSNGGGGGAGMGGAIFNQGAVVIERSTLTGNRAQGGSAGVSSAGGGGGGIGTDAAGGTGGGFGPGTFPFVAGGLGGAGDTTGAHGTGGAGGGGAGFRPSAAGNSASGPDPGAGGGMQTGLGGYGGGSPGAGGALGGDGSGGGGGNGRCGCGGFPDGDGGAGGGGGVFGAGGAPGSEGGPALDSDANGGAGGGGGGGGVGGGGGAGGTGGPEGAGEPGIGGHGGAGGFGAGGGEGGLAGEDFGGPPATSRTPGGSGGFGGGGGRPRPGPGNGDGGFGGGTATADTAGGGAGMGGAIFNMQGDLTIRASTLAGNSAAGGLPAVPDPGKGLGGAVFNLSGSLEAVGVTFADNTAAHDGSSIYNLVYDARTTRTAQATLRDTIVADASPQVDLVSDKPSMTLDLQPNLGDATALAGDFDLVRTWVAHDAGVVTGAPLTADPLLGPLTNNGGPTRTMAPSDASPVVDQGAAFGLVTDQRGLSRPFDLSAIANAGDGSDIGAVELPVNRPSPPGGAGTPTPTPAFGAKTLVTLTLAARRIPARGPLKVRVANANGFEIAGRLSGQTINRVTVSRKRRIKLRAKQFKVAAGSKKTVKLTLPRPLRRVLKRTGKLRLRLTANVTDPAGTTRTVKKRVTPRLKTKRRR